MDLLRLTFLPACDVSTGYQRALWPECHYPSIDRLVDSRSGGVEVLLVNEDASEDENAFSVAGRDSRLVSRHS